MNSHGFINIKHRLSSSPFLRSVLLAIRYLPIAFKILKIRQLIKRLQPREANKKLIRLGRPDGDGGYLLPDDLDGIAACFSPGTGRIVTFEEDFIKRGIPCFLADGSVEAPPIKDTMVHFTKKYLSDVSEGRYITLDDWVAGSLSGSNSTRGGGGGDLLLQMDIEGYEYDVLLAASDHLIKRFRIMIIEFHSLYNALLNDSPYKEFQADALYHHCVNPIRAKAVFDKLLQTHQVVHIHPNNAANDVWKVYGLEIPFYMEFTFARKDIVTNRHCKTFPHPLDRQNKAAPRHPLYLPKCWIGE